MLNKKKTILHFIEDRIPKLLINHIKKKILYKGYNYKLVKYNDSETAIKKKLRVADAVFFTPGRYLEKKFIKIAKNAKIFQLWSSGFDKFNVKDSDEIGIPVCNNGSENSISVAEHTVLLMLAVSKKLITFNNIARSGKWKGNSHGIDMNELYKKKLGIFGLGRIGKRVAQLCSGFNMEIYYYDIKKLSKKDEKKYNVKFKTKNHILKNSDIISLHLHYNKKTFHFLGKKELSMMKKSSILINVSRAELVDYKFLKNLVINKKISGAGIDVFYKEPTIPGDKLNNDKNVIATPHTAGTTIDTYRRVIDKCILNIDKTLKGGKPQWVIS